MYLSQQACCQCYSCNLDFPSVSISLYGFFLFNHPQTHTHTPPHAQTRTHKHTILNLTVHICPQSRTHYYCTSKCYRSPRHPYTPPFSNFWNSTAHCASPPHLPLSPQASLQPPPTPNGTLFLLTPTPPGCSRSQVSMVTLLQNVRAIFGLFVSSNQPVIHTCSPADTQPADCSVPQ